MPPISPMTHGPWDWLVVYESLDENHKNQLKNVGKYTSPMDDMGPYINLIRLISAHQYDSSPRFTDKGAPSTVTFATEGGLRPAEMSSSTKGTCKWQVHWRVNSSTETMIPVLVCQNVEV